MTTFETASIGDRVWCVSTGWGVITSIRHKVDYPITVEFDTGDEETFTYGGQLYSGKYNQILFWDEVEIKAPTKPLPELTKDDCVEVWNTNTIDPTISYKRHFSHFHLGRIYCYENGGTSWTSNETVGWSRWRIPE